jgi:hypothetical protein
MNSNIDGMSLDDKRTELLPPEKLGPVPKLALTADEHAKNKLPDVLARRRTVGGGRFPTLVSLCTNWLFC